MSVATVFALPLIAYLTLQTIMNLLILRSLRSRSDKARAALLGAFAASCMNGLYFILAAILMRTLGGVETSLPQPADVLAIQFLAGLAIGLPLWFALTLARKLGSAAFGRGDVMFADEVVLRSPPSPRLTGLGIANLGFIQPLGRELFFRGLLLSVLSVQVGWAWAVLGILAFEVLMRMNIAWLPANLVYTLTMSALFFITGNAACGLGAAVSSGMLQGTVLYKLHLRDQRSAREHELLK